MKHEIAKIFTFYKESLSEQSRNILLHDPCYWQNRIIGLDSFFFHIFSVGIITMEDGMGCLLSRKIIVTGSGRGEQTDKRGLAFTLWLILTSE